MNETEACVILNNIPSLSLSKAWHLIHHFGSAFEVLQASEHSLCALNTLSDQVVNHISRWKSDSDWKKDLFYCEQTGIELVYYGHEQYPPLLKKISNPPLLLYIQGKSSFLSQTGIGVVGSRHPTDYAKKATQQLCSDLCAKGVTIISGLAHGTDTLAHESALNAHRPTIAVIPCGLQVLSKERNTPLLKWLQREGTIVSEYSSFSPVKKHHCIERNRLISGLARGSLLIQAEIDSGSMHTLRFAFEQARHCFAIPGPITDHLFRGNHALIRQRKAVLVSEADEIFQEMETLFSLTEYPERNEKWKANKELNTVSTK